MSIPTECDVAVIGAGVGGLSAAGLLARSGLNVAVFEAQPQPGGYLSGFQRQGFVFDSAIQWLNQCQPGGLVNRVLSHVAPGFPVCPPMQRIRRYHGDSFDYLLTSNPWELRDRLASDFPADARGLTRLFEDARALGLQWAQLRTRFRGPETMSCGEKTVSGLKMMHWSMPMLRHLRITAVDGLARDVRSEGLQRIFCTETGFMAIIMPIGWAFAGDFQMPPAGGSQALIAWLVSQVASLGSHVLLGQPVREVTVQNGQATGVVLDSGEQVRSRYVMAACDVEALYERLLPRGAVSDGLIRRLHNADIYGSHLSVFLGLDCNPASLGLGAELTLLTRDDVTREEHSAGDPHKTCVSVIAPSLRDPTMAPPGKGTLTLHCASRMEYCDHWKTGPGLERGAAYRECKNEYGRILVERVEQKLAPGLRQHIAYMDVATPVTFWRYTGNRDGSIMGATPSGRNIRRRIAHYQTPVRNLLLAGHWAEYGGGVPMAVKAAANSSLMVLREARPAAFAALRDVMDGRA